MPRIIVPCILAAIVLPACSEALVDEARLVPIERQSEYGQLVQFPDRSQFELRGEQVLITDPTYLADVYNDVADPIAQYLRAHGVIVSDFGGDTGCPVWWHAPYLVLPTSMHIEELVTPPGTEVLGAEVGCDSGSFVFLPVAADLPGDLGERIAAVVRQRNRVVVDLPAGRYVVLYEQHPAPPDWQWPAHYRNIVVQRQ